MKGPFESVSGALECRFSPNFKSDFLSAEDIQDEGAGGEQGGYKDRKVYGGKQEDKGSGKEANFYFPGLTPFFPRKKMKERAKIVCPACGATMKIILTMIPKPPGRQAACFI